MSGSWNGPGWRLLEDCWPVRVVGIERHTIQEVGEGDCVTPELCRFFGIVIRMFCHDHEPAHFHAAYGEYEALIDITTLEVSRGHLPKRALALVTEWAMVHREDLQRDWQLARTGNLPLPIEPLE
ncbi:MAG: DUF4160 domain-containing protein [Magnetococcales bacterium]|nr:DUF4160 domain-containing protein [Magnetococcales bacterium]